MSDIYKVKIGDVWLSRDGSESERGCLLEILNIKALRELYTRNAIPCVDGTQVIQTFEKKDAPFSVEIFKVYKVIGDLLIDLFNTAAASGELIPFTATGGGNVDFDFDVEIISFDYTDTEYGWENARLNLIKKG